MNTDAKHYLLQPPASSQQTSTTATVLYVAQQAHNGTTYFTPATSAQHLVYAHGGLPHMAPHAAYIDQAQPSTSAPPYFVDTSQPPPKSLLDGVVQYRTPPRRTVSRSNGDSWRTRSSSRTRSTSRPSHDRRRALNNEPKTPRARREFTLTEEYKYSDDTTIKQQTPMARVADLAKLHKLRHEYQLVNESGPAHLKTYTVHLHLTDTDRYEGQGRSIKKAQQAAAQEALRHTQLTLPVTKVESLSSSSGDRLALSGAPNDRLNGLKEQCRLLKLPKPRVVNPTVNEISQYIARSGISAGFMPPTPYGMRMPFPIVPPLPPVSFALSNQLRKNAVKLQIGPSIALGFGATRADAICNACDEMRRMIVANAPPPPASLRPVEALRPTTAKKSAISAVHELAFARKMDVRFEVTCESGQPRTFLVKCIMHCAYIKSNGATILTEARATNKKTAKRLACERMIEQICQLGIVANDMGAPAIVPFGRRTSSTTTNASSSKARRQILVKENKASIDYGVSIHPVTRLIQVQQARAAEEPRFTFVNEQGTARHKEFIAEVRVGEALCTGAGPNKRLAKRAAAEQMLRILGYTKPMPEPNKSALKSRNSITEEEQPVASSNSKRLEDTQLSVDKQLSSDSTQEDDEEKKRRVTFVLDEKRLKREQAIEESEKTHPLLFTAPTSSRKKWPKDGKRPMSREQQRLMTSLARSFVHGPMQHNGHDAYVQQALDDAQGLRTPQQQLDYLAKTVGFGLQLTDFPYQAEESSVSATKGGYLSLVTLGVCPPRVVHGKGASMEGARQDAALNALRVLCTYYQHVVDKHHQLANGTSDPPPSVQLNGE